jgi:hypothetical protein
MLEHPTPSTVLGDEMAACMCVHHEREEFESCELVEVDRRARRSEEMSMLLEQESTNLPPVLSRSRLRSYLYPCSFFL